MRTFLESGIEFTWPGHLGECQGNHCDLKPGECIPLKWIRKISDTTKASIDKYKAPGFDFKEAFVVKTIRGTNSQKVRNMTANEVNNMRDLRHPHISALLGTFDYQERLSILIFPAACCDLHQFMKQLSKDLQKFHEQSDRCHTLHRDASPSTCTSTQDSTTTHTPHPHGPDLVTRKQATNENRVDKSKAWPLLLPLERKLELLRRYFVCLSEALSYLHESGVRHKDIKPKNILIDESGCVVLTDFGISRRFPKDKSHVTNNEWNFTRKYASPEMKDRRMPRDDPSDVFSLGCVFLEMATLLRGENLTRFSEYYTTTVNVSAKDEAYHRNLEKVYSWIEHLRTINEIKPVQDNWRPGVIQKAQGIISDPDNHMVAALTNIRQMLDEVPANRPLSKDLWQYFRNISSDHCKDCDPRQTEDIWKPSIKQQENAKTGLINRRLSAHVEGGFGTEAIQPFRYGEIDSTLLSAHGTLNPSDMRQGRGVSPKASLRSFSRQDHPKAIPRSKSPISQRPIDRPGSVGRSEKSISPRLQNSATSEELVNGEDVLSPSRIMAANIVDNSVLDDQIQVSRRIEVKPSGMRAVKGGSGVPTAYNPITNSQALQIHANIQEKIIYPEDIQITYKEDMPNPHGAIVVYDVSQTIAFVTVFADLRGKFSPLPRSVSR